MINYVLFGFRNEKHSYPLCLKQDLTKLTIWLKNTLSLVKASRTPRIVSFSQSCFHRVRNTSTPKEVPLYRAHTKALNAADPRGTDLSDRKLFTTELFLRQQLSQEK